MFRNLLTLSLAVVFSSSAFAVVTDTPTFTRAHRADHDDIISFRVAKNKPMMAWEINKEPGTVFLNYSRFAYGWSLEVAQVCYEVVGGTKYVGVGDSEEKLKLVFVTVVKDNSKDPSLEVTPTCKPHRDLIRELPQAKTVQGLFQSMN